MMQLILSPTSPYARKVYVFLREKGLDCERVIDLPNTPESQVASYNPLGKVPILRLDDGTCLYDSRVMIQYLEAAHPQPALLPTQPLQRALALRWEALADGMIDAAVAVVLESRREQGKQDAAWMERQTGKIQRALAVAEQGLISREWCMEVYGLADIALVCALAYLDLRLSTQFPWRQTGPNLQRVYQRLHERPAFIDSQP